MLQSNPANTATEKAIESVRAKRVEFRENVRGFLSPGTKQTVRNFSVRISESVRKARFDGATNKKLLSSFNVIIHSAQFHPHI